MSKAKKVSSFTFKDTFWSKKRVEANITIIELAKLFDVSRASMGAYLTGYLLPKEHIIKGMCEFFGVDLIEGEREFINAHKEWDAEHKKTLKASAKKSKPCSNERAQESAKDVSELAKKFLDKIDAESVEDKPIEDNRREVGEKLLQLIFRKVSYEKYMVVADYVFNDSGDPLAVIYESVDYPTFTKAQSIVQSHQRTFMEVKSDDSKWEI